METIGAQVLEILMKRRLLLGVSLLAAVPAATALWVLNSPARQEKPRSLHLPLRDAVAELPFSGASLTPIMDELGEKAEPTEGTQASARPAARREAPATIAQRLSKVLEARKAEGVEEKAEGNGGGLAPPMARGRLNPLQGLGSGAGGGAQTSASFTIARAPQMAGAGPLGSVGLVTAGASKRFSPAQLLRAGGVSGIMSGLRQATRLLSGGTSNPSFGGATGSFAGAPGFSAGTTVAGGLASVGGPDGGIGNMGGNHEGQNNSTFNPPVDPTVPLAPPPVVPPQVPADGLPIVPTAAAIARCEAFTQAAGDSAKILEEVRILAAGGAASLGKMAALGKGDADNWKNAEENLITKFDTVLSAADCRDARGVDHCAAAKSCLENAKKEVEGLRDEFERDVIQLASAGAGLAGAPPAGIGGYVDVRDSSVIEERLHAATHPLAKHATNGVSACGLALPRTGCAAVGADGRCVQYSTFGESLRSRIRTLDESDKTAQTIIKGRLDSSLCPRFGQCGGVRVEEAIDRLDKHNESLQVWAEEAPAGPLGKTAKALAHLRTSAGYLSAPAGNWSRAVSYGYQELKVAYDSLNAATGELAGLKTEACQIAQ